MGEPLEAHEPAGDSRDRARFPGPYAGSMAMFVWTPTAIGAATGVVTLLAGAVIHLFRRG